VNKKEAKHLSSYIKSELEEIMHELQFLLNRIEEAEEKINNCTNPFLKDACMLSTVQNINHYKISTYGTAAAFANTLGKSKTAVLFHECEVNEKQIDDRLSQLAEFEINKKARNAVEIPRYIK
jgi:ferritin-like metal-binding protein YciE